MNKYVWKCEGENCGKEFIADTPDSCPNCEGDDIIIIKETGGIPSMSNTVKKILIASIVIIAIALIWRSCNPKDISDGPEEVNGIITYILKVERHDNYFKITGDDNDELELYVEDVNSGKKLHSESNTFYPCEDGDFKIMWEQQDSTVKVEGQFEINTFTIHGIAHKDACKDQLKIYRLNIRTSNCTYTIMTNMDDNENLEVSLQEGSGYINQRLTWTYEQVEGAAYFYVRIQGTGIRERISIKTCVPPLPKAKTSPEVVVRSFDLYLLDINNNRKQFQDLLKDEPDIYFNGQNQEPGDFFIHLETELDNDGVLKDYSLSESDIEYGGDDKIIRLKITQSPHEHY